MTLSPIRDFALKAVLWLPLCFVIWFALAPVWVQPAIALAKPVLLGLFPGLFSSVTQGGDLLGVGGRVIGHAGYVVQLSTTVMVTVPAGPGGPGGVGVLEPVINPLVYAYSLPLFAGLAMATPLRARRRLLQLVVAFCVIWLTQAFGIVAEALKTISADSGAEGVAAITRAGLSANAIALAYQFAYLILPAVTPIALWIGFNRAFIVQLTARHGEPVAGDRGHSQPPTTR